MSEESANGLFDIDRREYLRGVAAAGGASLLGLSGAAGTAGATPTDYSGITLDERLTRANDREDQATTDLTEPTSRGGLQDPPENTGHPETVDDDDYVYDKYQKGLDSDEAWRVPQSHWYEMADSIRGDPESSTYDRGITATLGGGRQPIEPMAGWQYSDTGLDSWMTTMPEPPQWGSDRMAAEIAQCYWMAHFRDSQLEDLQSEADNSSYDQTITGIQSNVSEDLGWDTTTNPFRSSFPGVNEGPYISQFLSHGGGFGNFTYEPTINPLPTNDYLTSSTEVQNVITGQSESSSEPFGQGPAERVEDETTERWVSTPRDLASMVRDEPSYHHYYAAALQLLDWEAPPSTDLPFVELDNNSDNSQPYIKYGGAGILDLLARVAGNALDAAWHHKWLVHLRARPEKYAAALEEDGVSSHAPSWLASDPSVGLFSNEYLPQAYPEGAPAHPAYPSGHSTIAGACVTALKIFFDAEANFSELDQDRYGEAGDSTVEEAHKINLNGDNVDYSNRYTGDYDPTIAQELHKLADNVGIGRIWAGVHYWSDHYYGMRLGEQVALATVMDVLMTEYGGAAETSNSQGGHRLEDHNYPSFSAPATDGRDRAGVVNPEGFGARGFTGFGVNLLRDQNKGRDKIIQS